jgi:hypothetical protein
METQATQLVTPPTTMDKPEGDPKLIMVIIIFVVFFAILKNIFKIIATIGIGSLMMGIGYIAIIVLSQIFPDQKEILKKEVNNEVCDKVFNVGDNIAKEVKQKAKDSSDIIVKKLDEYK